MKKAEEPDNHAAITDVENFRHSSGESIKRDRVAECESENVDIIYSQYLIVRDVSQSIVTGTANNDVPNFKCFRKVMDSVSSIFYLDQQPDCTTMSLICARI